ncbi:MAG: hypothetical protein GX022_00600 [Clostridiaceae bacterium]|nr:hypothetical protein [Clostridiaceae bacterium]
MAEIANNTEMHTDMHTDAQKDMHKDMHKVDIFAKQVLGRIVLADTDTLWQEKYTNGVATGNKRTFRIYIINDGSVPAEEPVLGSPVSCVKLCKRVIEPDYPRNTLVCTSKSKVTHRYQLVLLVEYENGNFDVITLPRNLSNRLQYDPTITKAFVDSTVIDAAGIPVLQHQNQTVPYETLIIVSGGVNNYTSFEYTVSIPYSMFKPNIKCCYLEDPSLQSYILLKCFRYDFNILNTFLVSTSPTESVWTTIAELTTTEDIIDKLGIDQDVVVFGKPEDYWCKPSC